MTTYAADDLRQRGIQATVQRLAVLRAVSNQAHASADVVFETVELDIGTVSRQAVYDALHLLVENGFIRRIQPVGSPARYEDRVNDNHHHLVCRICGEVVDVDCVVGAAPCLEASDGLGFDIDEAEIVFWGRCPQCRTTGRATNRLDPRIDRRHRKKTMTKQNSKSARPS